MDVSSKREVLRKGDAKVTNIIHSRQEKMIIYGAIKRYTVFSISRNE